MFDIGFFELGLIFVIGLIVLGPQRLPIAIRTVMGWIGTIRGLANNVQNELKQELKLQELQESIKKAEQLNLQQLSPDLAKTVEELRQSAQKIRTDLEQKAEQTNTTLEQQIQEMKSAVSFEGKTVNTTDSMPLDEIITDTEYVSAENALSPAEQAEQAEENDEMAHLQQYYPEDDELIENTTDVELTATTKHNTSV